MKLNNICENKEYDDLANKFISLYDGKLKINKGTIITASNGNSLANANIIINADNDDIFDKNGVCILKFGVFNNAVLNVRDSKKIKSLKNLPRYINFLNLYGLSNLKVFDLDLQKSTNRLSIHNCAIENLSNVKIDGSVYISHCEALDIFDKFPQNMMDDTAFLQLSNLTLRQIKTKNNNIKNLNIINSFGISNFENLPLNIETLSYDNIREFDNWIGINEYKNLNRLTIENISKHKNMICVLLCEKLTKKYFYYDKSLYNIYLVNVFNKYMNIDVSTRTEYLMDCAVELIDGGYPEAAEL